MSGQTDNYLKASFVQVFFATFMISAVAAGVWWWWIIAIVYGLVTLYQVS